MASQYCLSRDCRDTNGCPGRKGEEPRHPSRVEEGKCSCQEVNLNLSEGLQAHSHVRTIQIFRLRDLYVCFVWSEEIRLMRNKNNVAKMNSGV
jgi:hypothetical protein